MKKGKPKPYKKKESKKKQYMILLVAAIMLFSGLYFGLRPAVEEGGTQTDGTGRITQYSITQAGDGMLAVIAEERPELVVLLGEEARIGENTVLDLMNLSAVGVYGVDAELAVNSYLFFRFYTTDVVGAVDALSPSLDDLLGDYILYRGYTGVQPGDTSLENQIYLLGSLNLSRGSLVKVLLLEKSSGGSSIGFVGFIKSVIPFGPVVKADVNSVGGFFVSGVVGDWQDFSDLEGIIAGLGDFNYQAPSVLVAGEVNETVLNLDGVEVLPQANATTVKPWNVSVETLFARLSELGFNYTVRSGLVGFTLPLGANLTLVEQVLSERNVTNVMELKHGMVSLPKEVVIENKVIPIENNKNFSALLFKNATEDQTVDIGLLTIQFGDQYIVNARQV